MGAEPVRILFICTGNSARSQLAEGLANHLGKGMVEAHSAGTMPYVVNRHAVEVLKEIGIDISGHYSKGLDEVPGPFDRVITLCDSAATLCPTTIHGAPTDHWSTPDPSFGPGGPEVVRQAFREVRDRLARQIEELIAGYRSGSQAG